jgi:hypothetical protein
MLRLLRAAQRFRAGLALAKAAVRRMDAYTVRQGKRW